MSQLYPRHPDIVKIVDSVLDSLIEQRREEVIAYDDYLKRVVALAEKVKHGEDGGSRPAAINTAVLRAIYDNLPEEPPRPTPAPGTGFRESVALAVDQAVRKARMDGWRGNPIKERHIKRAIHEAPGAYKVSAAAIFDIVKARHEY